MSCKVPRVELERMGRVVLLVRDFANSLAFYRDVLGLPLAQEPTDNRASFDAGGGVLLCLHGGWHGMPFDRADFGQSPDELLFIVRDLDATRAALIARGVAVAAPHSPAPGLRVAEFTDPDGRRVGIEERGKC